MARRAMEKIVAFIPPGLLKKYDDLAALYSLSRSELVRIALQREYQSLVKWCESTYGPGSESAADRSGAESVSTQLAAPSPAVGGDFDSQVQSLRQFCQVMIAQDPEEVSAEQLRLAAIAQALVLGLASEQAQDVADQMVVQFFPQPVYPQGGDDALGGDGPLVDLD